MNGLSEDERAALAEAVVGQYVDRSCVQAYGLGYLDRSRCDRIVAPAVEAIVAARLASVNALADEWEGYGKTDVAYHWLALSRFLRERAVLGSDAHTEQRGTGDA